MIVFCRLQRCCMLISFWMAVVQTIDRKDLVISLEGIELPRILACSWPARIGDAQISEVFGRCWGSIVCNLVCFDVEVLASFGLLLVVNREDGSISAMPAAVSLIVLEARNSSLNALIPVCYALWPPLCALHLLCQLPFDRGLISFLQNVAELLLVHLH